MRATVFDSSERLVVAPSRARPSRSNKRKSILRPVRPRAFAFFWNGIWGDEANKET
jgi:hypothetical protein